MKIHKSKSGNYYIRPYVFVNGVKKQTTYHFKTKEQALEKIIELKKGINTSKKTIKSDYSFEYVWLDFMTEQERKLKPTSYYSYKKSSEKHLVNHFRNTPIHSIDRVMINKAINYLKRLNVSSKHKNKLLNILKSFFKFAAVNYQTAHEWVNSIPSFREDVLVSNIRKRYYTQDDFNKFIKAASSTLERTLFTVLFYSGLRIGEIRALEWSDWNPTKKSIVVTKTASSKVFGYERVFTPKTDNSNRVVFIPDVANKALKELKQVSDSKTIFDISESQIHRLNNKISSLANVERIKIHEFRHSYATLMVKKGMTANILQKQLGHSDIKVTLKYYVHFELDDQSKEVQSIFNDLD